MAQHYEPTSPLAGGCSAVPLYQHCGAVMLCYSCLAEPAVRGWGRDAQSHQRAYLCKPHAPTILVRLVPWRPWCGRAASPGMCMYAQLHAPFGAPRGHRGGRQRIKQHARGTPGLGRAPPSRSCGSCLRFRCLPACLQPRTMAELRDYVLATLPDEAAQALKLTYM